MEKEIKKYIKRKYECLEDTEREIKMLLDKGSIKSTFHSITISTKTIEKKQRGCPHLNMLENKITMEYGINISYKQEDDVIRRE